MRWVSSRHATSNRARPTRVVCAALVCAGVALAAACGHDANAPIARVVIPPGSSLRAATDSLAHAGVVKWPLAFRTYAALGGRDREIRAGEYRFPRGASWSRILHDLTTGQGIEKRLTIPEGFAIRDMGPLFAHTLGTPAESLDVAVRDSALRAELHDPAVTLEGYLFPDTYQFPWGTPARVAVGEMVHRFEEVWRPEWDERVAELGLTRHELLTLASIVEEEARVDSERAVIAAVYYNRLRRGMPLQADPTVLYALGEHRDRVLYRDLDVDSPYNTYRHAGLPPGPISSPGRASIEAALFPASVPYLYFVALPDGHHEFSTTFREHQNARRTARRAAAQHEAARPAQ